jgi:TonB-linked SusC/RagA family outer membrane protein
MGMTGKLSRFLGIAAVVFGFAPAYAQAQGTTISGQVTGTGGAPVVGASVSVPTLRVGGFTDDQGRYTFTVPASATGTTVTVVARRLGFSPSSAAVAVNGTAVSQNFSLSPAATELQGVVVTALGETREKSQLGTAQQQLSTNELNETKTMNVVNSIQGKVSGVTITGSGTQGGSSRILLRGANSITGNNAPLFIVDGVAISSNSVGGSPGGLASANTAGGAGPGGGFDFGSPISDINPEDIATMTVLKGPNAAAIYGSRAANGVIIMTTKRGASTGGRMRTEASSTYTWENPSILPSYQNLYGQGSGGQFQFIDGSGGGVQDDNDQSFGPRLDGRMYGCIFIGKKDPRYDPNNPSTYDQTVPCTQFTSPKNPDGSLAPVPWSPHPDNVESFFNTGHTLSNTVAFSGGTERANARMSFGSDQIQGYIPNNSFHKMNGLLNASLKINDRLSSDASLQYVRNNGLNRPGIGYTQSVLEQFVWFGRQVDLNALRNTYNQSAALNNGPASREFNWNYSFHNNPFWLQYDNPESDTRDRFIGNVSATYKLFEGIDANLRTGSDIFRYNIDQRFAPGDVRQGTIVDPAYYGGFTNVDDYNNENTTDATIRVNRALGSHLQVNATGGGSTRRSTFNFNSAQTGGLTVPGIYNVSNAAITPTLGQTIQRRQVNSAYASADFTLNGWWTLGGTARNDWSSTLPKGNNSYFYPSVNTALVLTDAIPALKNRYLSYLKLRASTARVGADADPYLLRTTYTGLSTKYNGLPQFTLADALANGDLKPEITHSNEAGIELSFLDSRVTFDGSIYDKYTTNQIFNAPVSATTGFTTKSINAGEISNKGQEFLLGVTPIQTASGFSWNSMFNYGRNKSKITDLAPGVQTLGLGSLFSARLEARLNQPYGAIMGNSWLRDNNGNLLLKAGLPQRDPASAGYQHYFGSIQPQWTGGWSNTFSFRNVKVYGLLDFHKGGKIASITNMWGDFTGVLSRTVQGREVDWNNPGYVAKGIDVATGLPNTVSVTAEKYWQCIAYNCGQVIEDFVYDASYTKLRELSVVFDLPQSFASRLNTSAITLGLTGRNLKTWTKVPNIDPEFSYQTGNNQGIEFASMPNPRVWGLNVRITP